MMSSYLGEKCDTLQETLGEIVQTKQLLLLFIFALTRSHLNKVYTGKRISTSNLSLPGT